MITNGEEGWEREGEDSSAEQPESQKPFWGAMSVSWSLRAFFSPFLCSGYSTMNGLGLLLFYVPLFFFRSRRGEDRQPEQHLVADKRQLQLNSINSIQSLKPGA